MRRKSGLALPRQAACSPATLRLLYKTLRYLGPDTIYTTAAWRPIIQSLIDLPGSDIRAIVQSLPLELPPDAGSALFCIPCEEAYTSLVSTLLLQDKIQIMLISPHKSAASLALWNKLSAIPEAIMSLDCWRLALLLNNPSFKVKQHFRIR